MNLKSELRVRLGRWREKLNEALVPCGISIASCRESHSVTVAGLVGWALEGIPRVRFLQVGVNDGRSGDAVRSLRRLPGWSGIVMEPNPLVLEQLRRNTKAEPGTQILNAALGTENGACDFFYLSRRGIKRRFSKIASHLGSFSKEQVRKSAEYLFQQGMGALEIESMRIATIGWETLIDSHVLSMPDLVVLDTEGYDIELLEIFPFEKGLPSVLVFEYMWASSGALEGLRRRLAGYSYILFPASHDCICVHDRCFRTQSRWNYLQG